MARPHRSYVCMVREGIANGESNPEAVPEAVATLAISTIEGAVMSKLETKNSVNHLHLPLTNPDSKRSLVPPGSARTP